jgi:hypothetical protein
MQWAEVRAMLPNQWLIVEALEAHTDSGLRVPDRLSVIEQCPDGAAVMRRYRALHREFPMRELYFVHTSNDELEIEESR